MRHGRFNSSQSMSSFSVTSYRNCVIPSTVIDLQLHDTRQYISMHYNDVIMGAVASQVASLTIVYSTVDSKKTSKLRATGLCAENSPGTGEFPAQMASNAQNVSI